MWRRASARVAAMSDRVDLVVVGLGISILVVLQNSWAAGTIEIQTGQELVQIDQLADVATGRREQLQRRQRVAGRPAALRQRRVAAFPRLGALRPI